MAYTLGESKSAPERCGPSVRTSRPEETSQIRANGSTPPDAIRAPSGLHATFQNLVEWFTSVRTIFPVPGSMSVIFLSSPAVARRRPSGLHATASTQFVEHHVQSSSPVSTRQHRTQLSLPSEANGVEFGLLE